MPVTSVTVMVGSGYIYVYKTSLNKFDKRLSSSMYELVITNICQE